MWYLNRSHFAKLDPSYRQCASEIPIGRDDTLWLMVNDTKSSCLKFRLPTSCFCHAVTLLEFLKPPLHACQDVRLPPVITANLQPKLLSLSRVSSVSFSPSTNTELHGQLLHKSSPVHIYILKSSCPKKPSGKNDDICSRINSYDYIENVLSNPRLNSFSKSGVNHKIRSFQEIRKTRVVGSLPVRRGLDTQNYQFMLIGNLPSEVNIGNESRTEEASLLLCDPLDPNHHSCCSLGRAKLFYAGNCCHIDCYERSEHDYTRSLLLSWYCQQLRQQRQQQQHPVGQQQLQERQQQAQTGHLSSWSDPVNHSPCPPSSTAAPERPRSLTAALHLPESLTKLVLLLLWLFTRGVPALLLLHWVQNCLPKLAGFSSIILANDHQLILATINNPSISVTNQSTSLSRTWKAQWWHRISSFTVLPTTLYCCTFLFTIALLFEDDYSSSSINLSTNHRHYACHDFTLREKFQRNSSSCVSI